MKKTVVLAFGNPLVRKDRPALEICRRLKRRPRLRGVEFVECARQERLLEYAIQRKKKVLVLDVVKGIRSPALVDVRALKCGEGVSSHDFGIGELLVLGRQTGLIKDNVKVLGIPYGALHGAADAKKIVECVKRLILRA